MIFVAVGTQLPFDRLIRTVDDWARSAKRNDVLAQIAGGSYLPRYLRWERTIAPEQFRNCLERCRLVVAHAGIGTILSALELGKPVVVLPRLAALGEHRNDHQLATAERFGARQMVRVAQNEKELPELIDQFDSVANRQTISSVASPELISSLRTFIENTGTQRRRRRL